MKNFEQETIHALIVESRTAYDLSHALDKRPDDMLAELKRLKDEGKIREAPFESIELAEDWHEPFDRENGAMFVRWVYCGGPVSVAMAAEVAA
jgi:hypothetical protein